MTFFSPADIGRTTASVYGCSGCNGMSGALLKTFSATRAFFAKPLRAVRPPAPDIEDG